MTSFGLGIPFMPYYIQELGVTDPAQVKLYTGLLTAAPALTMAIMSPIWGMVADKFGRKMMILRAMFAAVLVIGGMGFAQNIWHIIFLRLMQGVFTGTITASSAFVASNTPDEKMSFGLGLMASSTFIGSSIGPLIGGHFAEVFGYRISFMAGGVLMFIGGLLVVFFVKEDPNTYGEALLKGRTKSSVKEIFTPLIMVMLLTMFLQRIARSIFSPFMPLYIQESISSINGAAMITGQIVGFTGFMTALAGITISQIGDSKNKYKLIVGLTGIGLILSIAVQFMDSLMWFGLVYGIMFFFLGGIDPIMTSLTAQNTPPERRGALFGFQGLVSSIGFMVSPMIGTGISIKLDNHAILWTMPVILLLNLMIFIGINLFRRGKKISEQ